MSDKRPPMTTTLAKLYRDDACRCETRAIARSLGKIDASGEPIPDDEPIAYERILIILGVEDMLWTTRLDFDNFATWQLVAVHLVRRMSWAIKNDDEHDAIDSVERHALGMAQSDEISRARRACWLAHAILEFGASSLGPGHRNSGGGMLAGHALTMTPEGQAEMSYAGKYVRAVVSGQRDPAEEAKQRILKMLERANS